MKRIALALALVAAASCHDITVRLLCRGDSTPAYPCDTCLVRCDAIDSLARGDSTP